MPDGLTKRHRSWDASVSMRCALRSCLCHGRPTTFKVLPRLVIPDFTNRRSKRRERSTQLSAFRVHLRGSNRPWCRVATLRGNIHKVGGVSPCKRESMAVLRKAERVPKEIRSSGLEPQYFEKASCHELPSLSEEKAMTFPCWCGSRLGPTPRLWSAWIRSHGVLHT